VRVRGVVCEAAPVIAEEDDLAGAQPHRSEDQQEPTQKRKVKMVLFGKQLHELMGLEKLFLVVLQALSEHHFFGDYTHAIFQDRQGEVFLKENCRVIQGMVTSFDWVISYFLALQDPSSNPESNDYHACRNCRISFDQNSVQSNGLVNHNAHIEGF